jgi:hypothetical protein
VTVAFSKAIVAPTLTEASVQLSAISNRPSARVNARLSLGANCTQLVITPTDLLVPNTVYQLTLTSTVTCRPSPPTGMVINIPPSPAECSELGRSEVVMAN